MATVAPIVDVRSVSKTYLTGSLEVHALRDVTFSLEPGRILALMGPSGSGKTTLLNILSGLDRPTRGEVVVDGRHIAELDADEATTFRRRHMGFVFQFFNLLPTMTAYENVALPLLAERLGFRETRERATAALDAVRLGHRLNHRPSELSGGEMQRVAIARALVMRPRLLLADEPTGNLDTATGDEILALLRRAVEETGLSVLLVTHSYLAAGAADRMLLLQDGHIVDDTGAPGAAAPGPRIAWSRPDKPTGR